ncbi:MAG: GNAT family N-acetyltransferase [Propionicimonas sp.]|nr:GNAT family N-acetyltransferase [Propionicimonas sp.]
MSGTHQSLVAFTTGPRTLLRTPRLLVRRFEPSDGAGLHSYLSRPEAVRYEPYGVQSLAQCEEEASRRSHDPAFWAVCLATSGTLVGNLYFNAEEPPEWRSYELGYVFHPDHWGNGYASEAARAFVGRAFADWGAHRVVARCNPANLASWRLLERCGFRREGRLVGNASFALDPEGQPVWQDTFLYGVLASEWTAG